LIRWKSTSDLKPRKERSGAFGLSPSLTATDDEDDKDCDDEDSEFALERWARKIRIELRQAEIAQLAEEADRAAEAGLESFTAKLSTYGNDDSLLSPASSSAGSGERMPSKKTSKARLKRRKSFSEGIKVPASPTHRSFQYGRKAAGPLGVMELRDVNEVFPSFSKFHGHLRTHLARTRVADETLLFKESPQGASSGVGHQSMLSSDLFKNQWGNREKMSSSQGNHRISGSHSRSPSDFFKHQRLASDLFKHNFQSLSFDRWIKPTSSSEVAIEVTASTDVLADHIAIAGRDRQIPKVEIPPGLEMPSLDPRVPETHMMPHFAASPESVRPIVKTGRSSLARALFDDEEHESDGDSAAGEGTVASQPISRSKFNGIPFKKSRMREVACSLPSRQIVPPPPPLPEHSDFMTPARLRVIRKSVNKKVMVEDVVLTPNSVIDTSEKTVSDHEYEEQASSSILLPRHLESFNEGDQQQRASIQPFPVNVSLKPRSSNLAPQRSSSIATSVASIASTLSEAPAVLSFDEVAAMRSNTKDAVGELEDVAPALSGDQPEREDVAENDCYEIGRMITPDCECEGAGENVLPDDDQHALASDNNSQRLTLTVKIFGSFSDRDDANSFNTGGIMHHSQTIDLVEQSAISGPESHHATDCTCLALSPVSSVDSACSTPVKTSGGAPAIAKPSLMRRASSANALSSLEQTPQGIKWNPFGESKSTVYSEAGSNASGGTRTFHHTAMSLFTRITPRMKSMYLPPRDNDDFLHNYLYCSKAEGTELQPTKRGGGVQAICENVSSELCFCSSFFPDSSLNTFLPNRRSAASMPLLSLSGDNNNSGGGHPAEAAAWFDLNQFEFLEQFSGRSARLLDESPWKVSFQAPALRKGESCRKMRSDSLVEVGTSQDDGLSQGVDEYVGVEEKKSDEKNLSRSPKHSRHLSYFPSRQGPQFALSDNQFEIIYGVDPETLADTLTRDMGVFGPHLHQSEVGAKNVGRCEADSVEVDVTALLGAGAGGKGGKLKAAGRHLVSSTTSL
jgi:hypothetical protein